MFFRNKKVTSGRKTYEYIQLIRSVRENGKVRQKVLASLGTLDQLRADGQLDRLVENLAGFSDRLEVVTKHHTGELAAEWSKEWGPSLIFGRLWEEVGLSKILNRASSGRAFQFDVERALFSGTLQRLVCPGSELLESRWVKTVYPLCEEGLELQHFYRALDVLAGKKERVEKELFEHRRALLVSEVDIAFFDTTTLYFEGNGPEGIAKRGHSKDHRPDLRQVVVGVVMSRTGIPISCLWWPGNTSDLKTIVECAEDLKSRFQLRRVILVCDRGMVSGKVLKELRGLGFHYIIGMRMRKMKVVRDKVLGRGGRYRVVKKNLKVKEVRVGKQRYILTYNSEEAKKEWQEREQIVQSLKDKLAAGEAKSFIGNKGYRRFLRLEKECIQLDEAQVKREARYDGKAVLRTSTSLPTEEIALTYRSLQQVERLFRDMKGILEARPFFHSKKDRVKAHLFLSFLALLLMAELRRRLEEKDSSLTWDEVLLKLKEVHAIKLRLGEKRYLLRSELPSGAAEIFRAAGVRPPELAREFPGQVPSSADPPLDTRQMQFRLKM